MPVWPDLRHWWHWHLRRGEMRPFEPFFGTVTKKTAAGFLVEDQQGETVLVVVNPDVAAGITLGDRVEVEPRRPLLSGIRRWRLVRRLS